MRQIADMDSEIGEQIFQNSNMKLFVTWGNLEEQSIPCPIENKTIDLRRLEKTDLTVDADGWD
ncbi:hypothetical protein [Reinekea sp. G2M2-21]|uniref:hypothetical protein n=1 Tax=Reinekea sp. G2M2-21 TaxID=2788942 RepID=UPI0018A92D9A|nr:hypothetical protein [Reinekea sp. G2M2-21]